MSIRAGRVGVNPADVDPITGHISAEASEGYTKSEADNKFLSKSDASSTYETKTEASTVHNLLQPKTLAVPISMLDGTKLTVETALQGLNSEQTGNVGTLTDLAENVTIAGVVLNKLIKIGKMVFLCVGLNNITSPADYSVNIARVPVGFRPSNNVYSYCPDNKIIRVNSDGYLQTGTALTGNSILINMFWVVD